MKSKRVFIEAVLKRARAKAKQAASLEWKNTGWLRN